LALNVATIAGLEFAAPIVVVAVAEPADVVAVAVAADAFGPLVAELLVAFSVALAAVAVVSVATG